MLAATVVAAAALAGCGSTAQRQVAARPAVPNLADVVASVRSGIVRIETETCDETAVGTGFLVGPRLVATVAHVIDGALSITLKRNGQTAGSATVIGTDASRDLALLRTTVPMDGHVFTLARRPPRLGADVAAIGFPLDLPLTVTRGTISGAGRTVKIDGINRRGLIQTDAAVNPGNSGGPLVSIKNGEVVGLMDLKNVEASGIGFAVSAHDADPLLEAWKTAPKPVAAAACTSDSGETASVTPAPARQPAPAVPSLTSFNGRMFSVTYPASWLIETAEASKGVYSDTTIRSASDHDTLLRVDVTPGVKGDPMTPAQQVRAALARQSGYQEIGFARSLFSGYSAVRWEFRVRENGVLLRKTDTFFIDAHGDEFAVLTEAPDASYAKWEPLFGSIRSSLVTYGE
jgi:S1-C subfamily serine protease